MGLQFDTYIFQDSYPSINEIINKATEISGLEIIKIKPRISVNVYIEDYHDYAFELAFKGFKDNSVEVYTYKSEDYNHLSNKEKQELELRVPNLGNAKTVNLQNYMGQEPTFFHVLTQALEELGGLSPYNDLKSEIVVDYPLSIEKLKKKQKKHIIKSYLMIFLAILMIPIMIPVNLLIISFSFVKNLFAKNTS